MIQYFKIKTLLYIELQSNHKSTRVKLLLQMSNHQVADEMGEYSNDAHKRKPKRNAFGIRR